MKKSIIFGTLALFMSISASQAKITFDDEKPQSGKFLTVNIDNESTYHNYKMNVILYSFRTGQTKPDFIEKDANVRIQDKKMSFDFMVPNDAEYILVKYFAEGENYFKTEATTSVLYELSGKPKRNSLYYKSLNSVAALPGGEDFDINKEYALRDIEAEIANYPDNNLARITRAALLFDAGKYDKNRVLAEVDLLKNSNLNEAEAIALSKLYSSLDEDAKATEIGQKYSKINPSSTFAEEEFLETLGEKSGSEFLKLSEIFERQYPNSPRKKEVIDRKIQILMEQSDYTEVENILRDNNYQPPTQAFYLAFIYLERKNNFVKAQNLLDNVERTLRHELDFPSDKSISKYEATRNIKSYLAETYRATGEFWLQQNETDKAIENFLKAKETFNPVPQKLYENLVIAYYIARKDSLAFSESEEAIASSNETTKILDINSKLFSEFVDGQKYTDYLNSLRNSAEKVRISKLQNSLVKRNIPLPVVLNVDGLPIDLNIYRGEILIIELFASWCQPCESGLASLVDMTAKGFDNAKVSAIAVNCRENTKVDKSVYQGEDFGKVSVFFDEKNAFHEALGLRGLPARVFVDQKGIVRYIQTGAIGKPEDERETNDIIKLLQLGY